MAAKVTHRAALGQEKTYNPFYGHLLLKLCQHSQNHKVTLQYCLWDQLKKTEKMALRQASHLARLMAFAVAKFALSLAILKVVEFDELSENAVLVLRLFLVHLLTHYDEGAERGMGGCRILVCVRVCAAVAAAAGSLNSAMPAFPLMWRSGRQQRL